MSKKINEATLTDLAIIQKLVTITAGVEEAKRNFEEELKKGQEP
jgi:hypothetical protein